MRYIDSFSAVGIADYERFRHLIADVANLAALFGQSQKFLCMLADGGILYIEYSYHVREPYHCFFAEVDIHLLTNLSVFHCKDLSVPHIGNELAVAAGNKNLHIFYIIKYKFLPNRIKLGKNVVEEHNGVFPVLRF